MSYERGTVKQNILLFYKLIRLDTPLPMFLLIFPLLQSLWISYNGIPNLTITLVFLSGAFLTRSAGCIINDIIDAEIDAKVLRTSQRPLAQKLITKKNALFIALLMLGTAFCMVVMFLTYQAVLLSLFSLLVICTYPYTKRFIYLPQLYLAFAWSLGILMVFMQTNSVNTTGYLLFFANIIWTFAYDSIFALWDMKYDIRLNLHSSAVFFKKKLLFVMMISYLLFMILMFSIGIKLEYNFIYYIFYIINILLITGVFHNIKQFKYKTAILYNAYIGFVFFIAIAVSILLQ